MPGGPPGGKGEGKGKGNGDDKKKEKKEPLAAPSHFGCKKKKSKGTQQAQRLPTIVPNSKCRLRLLKHERVKDYIMMEEEFIAEQQRIKTAKGEKNDDQDDDRAKLYEIRGSQMDVGSLKEFIDENHCIVSTAHGTE